MCFAQVTFFSRNVLFGAYDISPSKKNNQDCKTLFKSTTKQIWSKKYTNIPKPIYLHLYIYVFYKTMTKVKTK